MPSILQKMYQGKGILDEVVGEVMEGLPVTFTNEMNDNLTKEITQTITFWVSGFNGIRKISKA